MSEHPVDPSDPTIGALIRRKAAKLARLGADKAADRGDYAQDLVIALLSRAKNFDPARGKPSAFLHVVLDSAFANILRVLRAEKRTPPGQPVSPEGCVDPRQSDSDETHDMLVDVGDALARLPEHIRAVAERLAALDTIADIARDLGVARDTVYKRIRAMRSRFESRGLQQYLKSRFDTSRGDRVVL